MDECPNMSKCTFFMAYGSGDGRRAAVAGFIRLYCRGERQQNCIRKQVSKACGGAENVPPNMLPNGVPVSGTDSSSWSEEVKCVIRR
jgi:hypothetical protein